MEHKPYVYRIKFIATGQYYIGTRYSKNLKRNDILVTYFTHSKVIKKMIHEYGVSSFSIDYIEEYDTKEEAVIREQELIRIHIDDHLNLNGNIGNGYVYKPIFRQIPDENGITSYQKGAAKAVKTKIDNDPLHFVKRGVIINDKSSSDAKRNETIKNKMIDGMPYTKLKSDMMKKNNPMFDADVRQKARVSIVEYYSNESLDKKTERVTNANNTKHILQTDKKHSEWMLNNNPTKNSIWINDGAKNLRIKNNLTIPDGFVIGRLSFNITRSVVMCPHCNKSGSSNNMKRYHFDKCKKKESINE